MRGPGAERLDALQDEALLDRSAAGDAEAFATLYRRRQGGIYRFALHMSGSPAVAEEAVQESFLVLIRTPERFDAARGPLVSFLYGIARNFVLRQLERQRRHVEIGENLLSAGHHGADFERAERVAEVRRAVLALPPRYREAVVLCDLQEMSYADAAAVLDCPVGTVRSRLNRARAILAGRLEGAGSRCLT